MIQSYIFDQNILEYAKVIYSTLGLQLSYVR